jgi:hypothetical protein
MESKLFVNTLGLRSLCFVEIDYLPLLMSTLVVSINTNCMSFFIFSILNFESLVALPVNELVVFVSEYLEPSGVGAPDLHVVGSTCALDVP